jgi:hypothetical protein
LVRSQIGTVDAKKDGLTKRKLMLKPKLSKQSKINAKRLAAAAKVEAIIAAAALLLKKLLKAAEASTEETLLQKKTTKKLKHKFISCMKIVSI